jgi:hypothetical protein
VEITAGLRYVRSFGVLDLGAEFALTHRYNRDLIRDETNGYLRVELTLWPPRTGPPG